MQLKLKILKAISCSSLTYYHPPEIDVIISVGGFYGFYVIGVSKILKKLEKQNKIIIKRYSGSSVGSICSVLLACSVDPELIINLYEKLFHNNFVIKSSSYFDLLREELLSIIPENAYRICTNKVYITATQVTFYGLKHIIFSKYFSNEDLIDACMASSNMPLFISPYILYKYRNCYFIDGYFSSVLPILSNKPNQLLIKLYRINYYSSYVYLPSDHSIEGLIVKGAIEADKFFNNDYHGNVLCWYNVNAIKSKRIKKLILCNILLFGSYYMIKTIYYSTKQKLY